MRERYRAMKTKRAKGRLLDDFCEITRLERKHAIKVLLSRVEPLRPAGRKAVYIGAVDVLKQIWLLFDQPSCYTPCWAAMWPVTKSMQVSWTWRLRPCYCG